VGLRVQSSAPDPSNSIANGKANSTACQADRKGASVCFTHSSNAHDSGCSGNPAADGFMKRTKSSPLFLASEQGGCRSEVLVSSAIGFVVDVVSKVRRLD
jgi:hypothetical protein